MKIISGPAEYRFECGSCGTVFLANALEVKHFPGVYEEWPDTKSVLHIPSKTTCKCPTCNNLVTM